MNSPVFILCLGATVELEFERYVSGEVVAVNAEDDSTVKGDVVVPEEKAGQKGKGKKPRKSQKNPAPGPSSETKVNGKESKKDKGKEKSMVSQPKPKPSAPNHERLKISMVHGDVLILRGGDFIVRRFSVVLLGLGRTCWILIRPIFQYSLTRTRKSMSICECRRVLRTERQLMTVGYQCFLRCLMHSISGRVVIVIDCVWGRRDLSERDRDQMAILLKRCVGR